MDIPHLALSSAGITSLRPRGSPSSCPRFSPPPEESSYAAKDELSIRRYTVADPFPSPRALSSPRGLLGRCSRGTVTLGPARSLLLSDLVGLEPREEYWHMFLAPMSQTLFSAGIERMTLLTSLRTHLVAMDPVERGVLW